MNKNEIRGQVGAPRTFSFGGGTVSETTTDAAKLLPTIFNVEMSVDEADALAQFLKRVGYSDFRSLAKSDEEAYLMQAGAAKVAKSLADVGHSPR